MFELYWLISEDETTHAFLKKKYLHVHDILLILYSNESCLWVFCLGKQKIEKQSFLWFSHFVVSLSGFGLNFFLARQKVLWGVFLSFPILCRRLCKFGMCVCVCVCISEVHTCSEAFTSEAFWTQSSLFGKILNHRVNIFNIYNSPDFLFILMSIILVNYIFENFCPFHLHFLIQWHKLFIKFFIYIKSIGSAVASWQ